MHEANIKAWKHCKEKYPDYFQGDIKVLEVGSYNVNGSVRQFFDCDTYYGVDWRAGPGVDVVCFAHDMKFDHKFDTIISASMLEHDPYWKKSLSSIVSLMKDDGILLLSWGSARNPPHDHETAPDLCFHSLLAGKVIKYLEDMGIYIHEFYYEINIPKVKVEDCVGLESQGWGEVVLVAFKNKDYAKGEPHLDKLLKEDQV